MCRALFFTAVDTIPPSISCAQNVQQQVPCGSTSTGTQINFPATANDNCGAVSVTYSSTGATFFSSQSQSSAIMNTGQSTITATATDNSGLTATCTMQVAITEGIFLKMYLHFYCNSKCCSVIAVPLSC